jgi:hypothetical protein
VERTEQAQRGFPDFGRPIRDKGADSATHFHDAHRSEVANAGAQAGAADVQLAGKFPLRRDPVAGLQIARLDQAADVVNHAHRHVGVGRGHDGSRNNTGMPGCAGFRRCSGESIRYASKVPLFNCGAWRNLVVRPLLQESWSRAIAQFLFHSNERRT